MVKNSGNRKAVTTYGEKYGSGSYQYGNTVKKVHQIPIQEDIFEEERRISKTTKKNREKALAMNTGYVIFLAAAAAITVAVCVNYLMIRAEMTTRMKNIATLEQEVSSITSKNDAEYNRAITSLNLEEIRQKAMNELGMVYAVKNQIVPYQKSEDGYVKKDGEIPKEEAESFLNSLWKK